MSEEPPLPKPHSRSETEETRSPRLDLAFLRFNETARGPRGLASDLRSSPVRLISQPALPQSDGLDGVYESQRLGWRSRTLLRQKGLQRLWLSVAILMLWIRSESRRIIDHRSGWMEDCNLEGETGDHLLDWTAREERHQVNAR